MAPLHLLEPVCRYWSFPLTLIGLVPLVVGIILNLTADREFKRAGTTVKPLERSTTLVERFPFSFTRNPMYLGMTLLLLGVALLLGTLSPLAPVALFAGLMDRVFIGPEEESLARSFGEEWETYRAKVRRWI
jgi:protein-S-isoprenylcysteine O-methyltransferase Ste14